MTKGLRNLDRVALTGAIIGLASLWLGWLVVKPNRLASGVSLSLWTATGWLNGALILVLWLACLLLSLDLKDRRRVTALGVMANLILIVTFWFAGLSAPGLKDSPLARVSPGAGMILTLVGVYVLVFAARKRLTGARIWHDLVSWTGVLAVVALFAGGWLSDLSIVQELAGREERFLQELLRHISLFSASVGMGTLIGIPLGIWAARSRAAEKPIFFIAGITQTIPSLALFGLLIAPLSALSFAFPALRDFGIRGVGATPAVIALVIYSLLPIVQNTYAALRQLDPAVLDAGRGMGMSRGQLFRRVEAPLATPIILEGVRTALVQAVGNTAVAALIGAGGLGWFIFQGLGQAAPDLILLGTIPTVILALIVDGLMRYLTRVATPKGLAR